MSLATDLGAHYLQHFPTEAARFIETNPETVDSIAALPTMSLVQLFDRVDAAHVRSLFLRLPVSRQGDILQSSAVRTTLIILGTLEETEREASLSSLPAATRRELEQFLSFPADTAGYYMDRPIGQFRVDNTVGEALDRLRAASQRRIRSLYVVDNDNVLVGRVDMQDMALNENHVRLSAITAPVEGVAYLTTPREELVDIFDEFHMDSIPIVDQEHKLIGVVRYTALIQAAEDEASVDIQTMVGASADERALSTPVFAVMKRLPWLHINLLTAFLAASVVGIFESTIAQFTALAILMPVVAGQSGNAGSQALAVTMRGLALKEISILQWRSVLAKEVQVGIADGLALAVTCGLGVLVWSGSPGLALVIAIAMITSMIAAGIAGALVPMILVRLGQDPATAASIILTTVTDVSGFVSFLGTATLLSFLL
ncbi:MAG: magnesium transporter [Pseudomonadales bacterium]|nr:magnesium transporter [Pseudomonadales bacterium]